MAACQADLVQAFPDGSAVFHILLGDGRQADDGVHGGTDVVRHGGKEISFGLVGAFRLSRGGLQLPVQPHQPHDVERQQSQETRGNDHDEDPVHSRPSQLAHGNHGDQDPVVRGIDPGMRRQALLTLGIAEFQCAGSAGDRLLYLLHLSPARVVIGLVELIEIGVFKGMAVDDIVSFRVN